MDVGLMMIFASYGWDNIADDQVWDEDLRLARQAPVLGFDALWSAEHHFFDSTRFRSVSAASLTTKRRRHCGCSPGR